MPVSFAAHTATPFRLGLTPVFLDNDAEILDAMRLALSQTMGTDIILKQRRTYQEVTGLLLEGSVDAAWLCGFPYLQHQQELSIIGVPVWRGKPQYQSYLITGAGDDAATLADLRGGVHAFSDPDSNSGYLVTTADLSQLGFRPDAFFSRTIFTYGHRNVVRAVASGLARSGSVDGYVWEALATIEPELTKRTRVIAKSEWDGFPPFVAKLEKQNTPQLQSFKQTLLSLHTSKPGKAVLAMLQLDRIEPAPSGAFDSIAARIKRLQSADE